MDRLSLHPHTTFNIDATDLYSERKHWLSAFEIYAIASDLAKKNDAIQRAMMLHCHGCAKQCIFHMLPDDHKSLNVVKTPLSGYFAPKPNMVAERYKFWLWAQKADEPIDAYLTSLRELAKSCNIGTLEEEMIQDQIVKKCASRTLKQKLLQQEDFELAKTVKIAWSAETAVQEARLLSQGMKEDSIPIEHVHASCGFCRKEFSCYRCVGADGHSPAQSGKLPILLTSTDRNQPRRRRKVHPWRSAAWNQNLLTGLMTTLVTRVNPVLLMNNVDSSITVQINGQRTKMITLFTGCLVGFTASLHAIYRLPQVWI